ncbi:hypothetical protein [Legionella resiliens]|uniref:Coiled-coil protein n=1 Tax=Legionella resiliens TaxID=2905958 RepID=A0ABS8X7W1_9GAMM|nr:MULTISPECIES: hypothetical protein [unclassified Legionella]MCE0723990.1 hypothetical protein [Legionella sp. 9fVS26]MCE3533143.1 hypothetical protein [Legionella sp. 8cVS16]
MKNNRLKILEAQLKELQRDLSLIQARRDSDQALPEELKHQLWIEAKQVNELVDRLLGGHHGKK